MYSHSLSPPQPPPLSLSLSLSLPLSLAPSLSLSLPLFPSLIVSVGHGSFDPEARAQEMQPKGLLEKEDVGEGVALKKRSRLSV